AHHRRYVRWALRRLNVQMCTDPTTLLPDWVRLYRGLANRHCLSGMRAFSTESFNRQFEVPGFVMFGAHDGKTLVGAQLCYVNGEGAYDHLTACDRSGYETRASYALYWTAISHFATRVRWADLGGTAGLIEKEDDGLSRFKRGWTGDGRIAYF